MMVMCLYPRSPVPMAIAGIKHQTFATWATKRRKQRGMLILHCSGISKLFDEFRLEIAKVSSYLPSVLVPPSVIATHQ